MAGNCSIKVRDAQSANAWLQNVMEINEAYYKAMTEAGQCLEDAQTMGEGTIVDEIVNIGSNMLTATKSTFDTINVIADTVTSVLKDVGELAETVGGFLSSVAKIFG